MQKEDAIQLFREECLENQKEKGHAGDVAPQTGRDSKNVPVRK